MNTTLDRVPKELSEFLAEEAKKRRTTKTKLYKQIEEALKGIPPMEDMIDRRKKDDKPPFSF
jgi:hypothetical protein